MNNQLIRTAIFPGSFDPITQGHLDIIKRASNMVDTLFVAVLQNEEKTCLLSLSERISKIKKATNNIPNIQIISFEGLLTDCMRAIKTQYIIRSIRNVQDYEYEKQMEQIYKSQNSDIECIYILADPQLAHISSTVTKQLIKLRGNTKDYEID